MRFRKRFALPVLLVALPLGHDRELRAPQVGVPDDTATLTEATSKVGSENRRLYIRNGPAEASCSCCGYAGRAGSGLRALPAGLGVLDRYGRMDPAAHVESGGQAKKTRCDCGNEIVDDLVRDGFVEGADIAERPDVEFKRFQFDTELIGNIFELESCEIGLTRLRAQAGKLRNLD